MARRRRKREPTPPTRWPAWDELHPTLDLHGETADDARRRAERWLRERQAEGARTVRLITGRGMHSVGPPVLPGEIRELLTGLRGGVVSRFDAEPGGGAFRVELTRPRPRRSAPRPPPDPRLDDAELRRRAEESLWELGVDPTPAVLEAEMRRLLQEDTAEGA